jgi:hypothetical protein
MFGEDTMSPEMEQGTAIARREMPRMAPVEPYGLASRMLGPRGALGYTSPGGNIYMNPATSQGQSPQEIADTLTHEQEHVNQQKNSPYGPTMKFLMDALSSNEPYHRQPEEMAAFQAEKQRRSNMGRMQSPIPSFSTGEFYTPQDINLPLPKARR